MLAQATSDQNFLGVRQRDACRIKYELLKSECVNDFATPCFMNLRYRVVLFQSASFALVVG